VAIPYQVGDTLVWDVFDVPGDLRPLALTRGGERLERVVEITLRAHPDNASPIFLGDARRQDFPLTANESATFSVSRIGNTYFRGAAAGDRLLVVYSMASEPIPNTDLRQAGPNTRGIPQTVVVTTGAFLPDPYAPQRGPGGTTVVVTPGAAEEIVPVVGGEDAWDERRAVPWRDDRRGFMR
jgi:hypothetical protein